MTIMDISLPCRTALQMVLFAVLAALPLQSTRAAEVPSPACTEQNAVNVFDAVKSIPSATRLVGQSKMLAGDSENSLLFNADPLKGENYRLLLQGKPPFSTKRLHLIDNVIVQPANDTKLLNQIGLNSPAKMITAWIPQERIGWWTNYWRRYRIFLINCTADKHSLVGIANTETLISPASTSMGIVTAVVALIYLWLVTVVHIGNGRAVRGRLSFWKRLDPVVLTAGSNGKGSLSKFQLLFFSLIVFVVMIYIYARIQMLSDLSQTVLILLGISAVGAAASKATDVKSNRLTFANWVWMIRKQWLPPGGLAAVNIAKWSDLVTSDGEFDVYRFQMLIFSLVVGVSLLGIGLYGLASFDMPANLLGLLGLSQVVYIGGKLVAPPSCAELDGAVTALRELEGKFKEKAATQNQGPPPTLDAAKGLAPTEYAAFKHAVGDTAKMAAEVLGYSGPPAPVLEPDFA